MISHLIAERGMIPATYEPYIPVRSTIYHFGFHADTAFYQWLSGLSSERAVLIFGQVLNALCAVSAYLAAARLLRSRLAGLSAFIVVGFISTMPAYYVSWGRYTQLTGLIILPGVMVALVDGLESSGNRWRWIAYNSILGAGLLLTHYRVVIIAACFALLWIVISLWRKRKEFPALREMGIRLGIILAGALLLTAPWVYGFVRDFIIPFGTLLTHPQNSGKPTAIPWQLLHSGHDRLLIALAVAGALWGTLRRNRFVVSLILWVGLVILVANSNLPGLPSTWLITNTSVMIALFLPVSILIGYLVAELARLLGNLLVSAWRLARGVPLDLSWRNLLRSLHRLITADLMPPGTVRTTYRASFVILALVLALWGGWETLDIINPITVLATLEDLRAMDWIRANTPPDALFLINTRGWQYNMQMGTDGGWWIPLLTGRRTTLPPVLYTLAGSSYSEEVNHIAEMVAKAASLDEPPVRELLERIGVTHVYIGARGGHLTPQMLLKSDDFRPVYCSGEVWIFARRS